MDYDKLVASFSRKAQYEAARTAWMLDAINDCGEDVISISQLESALARWSLEAGSTLAPSRRLSFDVPLPAKVADWNGCAASMPWKKKTSVWHNPSDARGAR
jgi:hypothetical protein